MRYCDRFTYYILRKKYTHTLYRLNTSAVPRREKEMRRGGGDGNKRTSSHEIYTTRIVLKVLLPNILIVMVYYDIYLHLLSKMQHMRDR